MVSSVANRCIILVIMQDLVVCRIRCKISRICLNTDEAK